MMDAVVLHVPDNLNNHSPLPGRSNELRELGATESDVLIAGKDAHARHLVDLLAAPQILVPIWPRRIDGPERAEKSLSVELALLCQPGVHGVDVLVEKCLVAAGPGFCDPVLAQLCHEGRSVVAVFESAVRPLEQTHVG